MNPNSFGTPIDLKKAQAYTEKYNKIMTRIKAKYEQAVPAGQQASIENDDNDDVYVRSTKNAFVFDRDLVLELLNKKEGGLLPQYLMVNFAAKYEDKDGIKTGEPTIVLLGVVEDTTKPPVAGMAHFRTLAVDDPGAEQPGGTKHIVELKHQLEGKDVLEITLSI